MTLYAAMTALSLTLPQTKLPWGGTAAVKVTGTFSNGTTADLTDAVTYQSSAPHVASSSSSRG